MRNFLLMATNVDVGPLVYAITQQPELWNQFGVRTFHTKSVHRIVDDIILRYNKFDKGDDFVEKVCSELAVENYPAMQKLPQARPLIFTLMTRVEGEHLGRVLIARMPPGTHIPSHTDIIPQASEAFPNKIPPAIYYDRYHLVLKSKAGAIIRAGDEQVHMAQGELWWFDNTKEHEVINNSDDDRIHMIIDIHSSKFDYVPK